MRNKTKILLFLVPWVFITTGFAVEKTNAPSLETNTNYIKNEQETPSSENSKEISEIYGFLNHIAQSNMANSKSDAEILGAQIKLQSEQIEALKNEITQLKIPASHDLTAVILTGVAVIITTLGVLIAILSIYGYRNIRNDSIKVARKTAAETVSKITPDELSKSLEKIMEGKGFNNLIKVAVEKVAYRGIDLDDPLLSEDENLEDLK